MTNKDIFNTFSIIVCFLILLFVFSIFYQDLEFFDNSVIQAKCKNNYVHAVNFGEDKHNCPKPCYFQDENEFKGCCCPRIPELDLFKNDASCLKTGNKDSGCLK